MNKRIALTRCWKIFAAVLMAFSLPRCQVMHIDQRPSLWRQASRSTGLPSLSAEEIAARAYAKYLTRERVDNGAAVNDWLEAERELLHEKILSR